MKHIYMKLEHYYFIFVLHVSFFFSDSLEFWVNLENIHPTLTVVKIAIAVKSIELKNNISPTSAGM